MVLVDQRGAHAFVKIVSLHKVLGQPVFELERLVEIVIMAEDQLAQRDLEAGRRFGQQCRMGLGRPSRVGAAPRVEPAG
jgi:hypothetical protein